MHSKAYHFCQKYAAASNTNLSNLTRTDRQGNGKIINQHRNGTNNDIWVANTTSQQWSSQTNQVASSSNGLHQMSVPRKPSRVFVNPSIAYLAGQRKPPPYSNQSNEFGLPSVSKSQKILINPNFMTSSEKKLVQMNIEKNFHSMTAKEEHVQTSTVTTHNINRTVLEESTVRPKTILVNPNFKGSKSLPSIHINSKVFATAPSTQQSQPPVNHKFSENQVSSTSKPVNEFAVNTTKKLVRQIVKEVQPQTTVTIPQVLNPLVSINKRKLVRLSSRVSNVTPAQRTCTENRNTSQFKPKVVGKEFAITKKYSLKRVKVKPNSDTLPQSSKYKFIRNTKPDSSSFSKSRFKLNKKVVHSQSSMKNYRKNLLKSHIQGKYNWQRSIASRPQTYHANKRYQYRRIIPGSQDKRFSKFNINGRRFVMDPQGKTLRHVPVSKPKEHADAVKAISLNRIYVAGATYKAKAPNVYVRTNDHAVKNLVSQAKYKSISLLVNKLRKNNKPCVFYRRFGKCIRKEKGTCPCVHDPKQIAICFYGDKDCLLSHDVRPEKMPTCQYFLDGCCTRKPCPYLHVKVNAKANICQDFVAGYCASGSLCKKRHVNICPGTPHSGTCNKGKECPFLHKNPKKKQQAKIANPPLISPIVELAANPVEKCDQAENSRYYQSEGTVGPPLPLSSIQVDTESQISNPLVCVSNKKRQKIGTLPSFIPL
ncbi:hypothetical protein B566_EDAN001821 [Ephemera danica]|nr:hypothetical protein B566_EDAN001821 [Ephemera danica]